MKGEARAKHETLYRKADYLSAELEEVTFIFEECKKEFFKKVSRNKSEPPKPSVRIAGERLKKELDDLEIEIEDKSDQKGLKGLYRKVMLKSHPDKLIGLSDPDLKSVYEQACSKAMLAMDCGSWYLLVSAAKQVGINDFDITMERVDMLRKECKDIENKIERLKKSIPWIWFHSDDRVKEFCVKQYNKNVNKN